MKPSTLAAMTCVFAAILTGTASAEICSGTNFPLRTGSGSSAPYIDLLVEGKTGPFLIDYGAGGSSLEEGIWTFAATDARWRGTTSDGVRQIYLPSNFPGWVNLDVIWRIYNRDVTVTGVGAQHGVIGTDMINRQNLVFEYGDLAKPTVTISAWAAKCDSAHLQSLGFHKIGQAGHWVADGTAKGPNGVHNGPVVYIELAADGAQDAQLGARAWAQIDTGYENNRLANSIDINQAMFDRLSALDPPPVEQPGLSVTECGLTQVRRVFTLPGRHLRIEDEAGKRISRINMFSFVLKPPSTPACGGISDTSVPAAQLGASFLRTFGTTIFAGETKEVWIKP